MRQRSEAEKKTLVEGYKTYAGTIKDYCNVVNVKYNTFITWRARYDAKPKRASSSKRKGKPIATKKDLEKTIESLTALSLEQANQLAIDAVCIDSWRHQCLARANNEKALTDALKNARQQLRYDAIKASHLEGVNQQLQEEYILLLLKNNNLRKRIEQRQ